MYQSKMYNSCRNERAIDVRLLARYHSWMQSEELREQTASERLTLQEEYEMQQKWISDDDSMYNNKTKASYKLINYCWFLKLSSTNSYVLPL